MKILTLILASIISLQIVNGQNCFVVSEDITGIENEFTIMEEAACALRDSLPSMFRDQFKVIHAGSYLHSTRMTGAIEHNKESFIQKANSISPHFLLIIHYQYSDGHSEYDVEFKLPENWLSECYDDLIITAFLNSIKTKFTELQIAYSSAHQKTQVETEGIKYISERLGKFTECCLPGSNFSSTTCTSCITAYDVLNELKNLEFIPYYAGEVTNSNLDVDQYCICEESTSTIKDSENSKRNSGVVSDHANLSFLLENTTYDFGLELSEWSTQGNLAIVTKNSTYCDQTLFLDLQSQINSSDQGIWVHIWENPKSDDEDIVFIKFKQGSENGTIAPETIEFQTIQADPPPSFEYTILHRSFAPWDRFGHMPVFWNIHAGRNAFWGDNRGFSLDEPDLVMPGTTARIHQRMKVKLGSGKVPLSEESIFSSLTRGYKNFRTKKPVRMIPHPYKEELDTWEYEPVQEQDDFCNPSGFENAIVQNNITYTSMFFEGADPLIVFPMPAPDIEWYLELGIYYTSNDSLLNISGKLIGKSFPAYEAYIEDKCGTKIFLYTYEAPCESQLAIELMNPFPNFNEGFDISIKVNEEGCFQNEVKAIYGGNTLITDLESWNQQNLEKIAAKDCPSNPCQGAYPNDNSDKTADFNCGN